MYELNKKLVEGQHIRRELPPEIRSWLLEGEPLPSPSAGPGVAVVLFRAKEAWPCFRSGFGIPFQWRRDAADDEADLPVKWRVIAKDVRDTAGAAADTFHLSLSEPDGWRGRVRLSEFPATLESGFAPLLASLILAVDGLSANPANVMVTGAASSLDGRVYLREVEGVPEKREFSNLVGANLYVAVTPEEAARLDIDDGHVLSVAEIATKALQPAIISLAQEPPSDAEPPSVIAYHHQLALGRRQEEAARFFCKRILPILGDLGADFSEAEGHLPTSATLVTSASNAIEIPSLTREALRTLGVEICKIILLHDSRGKDLAGKVRKLLEKSPHPSPPITLLSVDQAHDMNRVFKTLQSELQGFNAPFVFDLTPGFKTISLAMTRVARPDDTLLYMQHVQRDHVADPTSYRLWAERITPLATQTSAGPSADAHPTR